MLGRNTCFKLIIPGQIFKNNTSLQVDINQVNALVISFPEGGPGTYMGFWGLCISKSLYFPNLWGIFFKQSPQHLGKTNTYQDLKMHFIKGLWTVMVTGLYYRNANENVTTSWTPKYPGNYLLNERIIILCLSVSTHSVMGPTNTKVSFPARLINLRDINEYVTKPRFSVCTVSYGSSFFSCWFIACTLLSWVISQRGL